MRISTTSYQKKHQQNQNGLSRNGEQSFGARLASGGVGPRKSRERGVFNRGAGGEMELTWKV